MPEFALAVPGALSLVIDGQFGSTGKGKAAAFAGTSEHFDIYVTNAAPNAGHSFVAEGRKRVASHLPVGGILNDRSTLYLCAGSVVEPKRFLEEIEEHGVDPATVFVHPRAAVVEPGDQEDENRAGGAMEAIGSTRKGVGSALARKVRRTARLAGDHPDLRPFCAEIDLSWYLDQGLTALMEVPQGFGLGLNSGLSYPHCTSRDISVSAALADAQLHPRYLGKVMMCVRAFPIRVGHVHSGSGERIGDSGPFWPDSRELDWAEIGVEPERTTVTGRVRRVATFSLRQYAEAVRALRPDVVMLTFADYLDEDGLAELLAAAATVRPFDLLSYGPGTSELARAADVPAAPRQRRGQTCRPR